MPSPRTEHGSPAKDDYVRFSSAGQAGKGEYRCSECSYGVTVHSRLPVCPMCAGRSWEQSPWSPFSRAARPV